jgi:ElaB/YqjD/DUF883 family membrane-anchored ribosome-binding protein
MPEISARKLMTDCRIVMYDVQQVVRAMAGQAIQRIGGLRERRREHENRAEAPAVIEFTAELAHETWGRVALAAGMGLVAGLMLRPIVKRMV